MTQQQTQPTDTPRRRRPERNARETRAMTEAELAQVVAGGDGPVNAGDNNGRQ